MGDFDKKPAAGSDNDAAAKEKKKLVFVGLLGVVLAAIVGYHYVSSGPQKAGASVNPENNPLVPVQQTPEQALASLDPSHDPTAKLLLTSPTLPVELTDVPRNPFKISEELQKQLIKPPEVKPVPAVVHSDPPTIPVPHPKDPGVNPDDFKLTAIFQSREGLYASINGNLVTEGSVVGDGKIVSITPNQVVLRHKDYPGGPLTIIKLSTKKFGE